MDRYGNDDMALGAHTTEVKVGCRAGARRWVPVNYHQLVEPVAAVTQLALEASRESANSGGKGAWIIVIAQCDNDRQIWVRRETGGHVNQVV